MKCLNKRAEAIFRKLIEGLVKPGDHRKVDNTNGSFMAGEYRNDGRVSHETMRVSLAHYHLQSGDVMGDPDVEFLVGADGQYFRSRSSRTTWASITVGRGRKTASGDTIREAKPTSVVSATVAGQHQ